MEVGAGHRNIALGREPSVSRRGWGVGVRTHCSRGDQGLAGTARPSWGAFVSTGNSPHFYRDLGALGKVQRAQGAGGPDPTLPADPDRGRAGALQPGAAPCAPPPQRSLTLLGTAGSPPTRVSAGSAANPRRAGECASWGPGRRGRSPPALPPTHSPPRTPGALPGAGRCSGPAGARTGARTAPPRPGRSHRCREKAHARAPEITARVRIPGSGGRRGGGRRAERRGRGGPRGGRPRRDAPGGGGQGKRVREVVPGGGGGL